MTVTYADDKLVRGQEIRELYQEAGWTMPAGRDPAEIEAAIRHLPVFITAREGARLVGFVAALTDRSHYAHVTELMVRRSHVDRGVGAELMRRVLDALPSERAVTIFAEPEAEAFYRQLGFAPMAGAMMLRRG
jgi:GNAT superfamily N-acetyltransferase